DQYLDAMKKEIDNIESPIKGREVSTIFWGGGTPTLFSGLELGALLDYIRAKLPISKEAEITIEANPETLDEVKLRQLKKYGINRLSMGMQAAQDRHLKGLGRVHSIEDVKK